MSAALIAAAAAAAIVTVVSVIAFAKMPALLIWAAFIGWASYDHSGANAQAFVRSSAGLIFGVVMAWAVVTVSVSGSFRPAHGLRRPVPRLHRSRL